MKKKWGLIILLLILVVPTTVYAWSWKSLFNWWPKPAVPAVTMATSTAMTEAEKTAADVKYNLWDTADKKNDIKMLIGNQNNFVFTEAELNYFAAKSIGAIKSPKLSNVKIVLDGDIIKVSGTSLISPFKGDIVLEGKVVSDGAKIKVEFSKVEYKGWPWPAYVASAIINKYDQDSLAFLYSYPDYKTLAVVVKDKKLELQYQK